MDIALLWVIAGVVLILSELLATSIIAVFFGAAAIMVGLLMWLGLVEAVETQLFLFSAISLLLLFSTRARLRRYLIGDVADRNDSHKTFRENLGEQAVAIADFQHGQGKVRLNGVSWQARAAAGEDIHADDPLWITANDGIVLTVSKQAPTSRE